MYVHMYIFQYFLLHWPKKSNYVYKLSQSKYLDNKVNCKLYIENSDILKWKSLLGKSTSKLFQWVFLHYMYVYCIYGVAVLLYKACCMWCTMESKSFYAMLALEFLCVPSSVRPKPGFGIGNQNQGPLSDRYRSRFFFPNRNLSVKINQDHQK